ncbi:MAG: hypothetical protein IPJ84_01575 [Bdellovibrionales bacterium]|nr:hypothetical protein [Bdellovibrionales bacterium]
MKNNDLARLENKNEPLRTKIMIVFEFSVLKPKTVFYRGVKAADGGHRMEKRGVCARKFKPFMWCGSLESLYQYQSIFQKKSALKL